LQRNPRRSVLDRKHASPPVHASCSEERYRPVRLVRNWGRIGTNGRELVKVFADEIEAR
jgi:WGR domain